MEIVRKKITNKYKICFLLSNKLILNYYKFYNIKYNIFIKLKSDKNIINIKYLFFNF